MDSAKIDDALNGLMKVMYLYNQKADAYMADPNATGTEYADVATDGWGYKGMEAGSADGTCLKWTDMAPATAFEKWGVLKC